MSTAARKSDAKGSTLRAVRRAIVGSSVAPSVPAARARTVRSCTTSKSTPMATSARKSKTQRPTESKYCCALGALGSQLVTPHGL